jgi:hypothetical protein
MTPKHLPYAGNYQSLGGGDNLKHLISEASNRDDSQTRDPMGWAARQD